jgi:hypothetical protein
MAFSINLYWFSTNFNSFKSIFANFMVVKIPTLQLAIWVNQ